MTVKIVVILALNVLVSTSVDYVENAFRNAKIVPDVIPKAPTSEASVQFPSGATADLGNLLTPDKTAGTPDVTWPDCHCDQGTYYTLLMIDPDVPALSIFLHWQVVNIPCDDVTSGDTVTAYLAPTPPPPQAHRYIQLVYRQAKRIHVKSGIVAEVASDTYKRVRFNISKYVEDNQFKGPVAGNFVKVSALGNE